MLVVERSIGHESMKSHENVYSDESGIDVADYDGGAILAFKMDGTLLWRTPLPLAHGVHVDDESSTPPGSPTPNC